MPAKRKPGRWGLLGRGNSGAVLQYLPGRVVKWTVDPVEIAAWIGVGELQRSLGPVPGLPHVDGIYLGRRQAAIVREDIRPLAVRSPLGARVARIVPGLLRGSHLEARGRAEGSRELIAFGRRAQDQAFARSGAELADLRRGVQALHRWGAATPDIRPMNLGTRTGLEVILLDPGRPPKEGLRASPGEAWAKCPNEGAVVIAVQRLLGHAPNHTSCAVVGAAGMREVMGRHGWSDAEIDGTAGFHSDDGKVLLRKGQEWSLLHEMVHSAGVVDRSLAPWLTEGITEAAAQDIAHAHGWGHTPTYPREVEIVRRKICPVVGMTPIQLGALVARGPQRAGSELAQRLAQSGGGQTRAGGQTGTAKAQWMRTLKTGDPAAALHLLKPLVVQTGKSVRRRPPAGAAVAFRKRQGLAPHQLTPSTLRQKYGSLGARARLARMARMAGVAGKEKKKA